MDTDIWWRAVVLTRSPAQTHGGFYQTPEPVAGEKKQEADDGSSDALFTGIDGVVIAHGGTGDHLETTPDKIEEK